MESINYSDNWNGKLLCDCWADVRKPIPARYSLGNILEVNHATIGLLGYAKVIAVQPCYYKNINDNMAYTVTGKSANFLRRMLSQFYGQMSEDTPLVHVVLQFTQRHAETLPKLLEKQYDRMLSITPKATQYADGPHQQ